MKVNIIGKPDTLFNHFIAELRDAEIQKDPFRFRYNFERIGQIFAYEISKTLSYEEKDVVTSLGTALVPVLKRQPVLATILRAGLPLHNGILSYFDQAPSGFISAFRKTYKDGRQNIHIEYVSCPDLTDEILILSDALIATGLSMVLCYKELLTHGQPLHTHIVTAMASSEGIDHLKRHLPKSTVTLWVGAVDDELTAQAFIVPGMGDAGDLAYGRKEEL
ncbi:MAG: uracil phosphoribosyltransferase [Bacteroidetes bacterium]|nr:uracil phosphoribosyltransferase [Bacteroidota bacterium]